MSPGVAEPDPSAGPSMLGAKAFSPASRLRIVWCSPSFGYDGELMYFHPLLSAFSALFPEAVIPVARDFPVERYPDVRLSAILDFRRRTSRSERRRDETYISTRRVPTVATILRLAKLRADCYILLEFTPMALTGFVLSKLRRVPSLMLLESDPSFRGASDPPHVRLFKRFVARRVSHVLVNNAEGAEYFHRLSGRHDMGMTVAPFLTSALQVPRIEAPQGDPPTNKPVRFLFTGRTSSAKGLPNLISALALLGPECRGRWTLNVVGAGDEMEAMQQLVTERELTDVVTFHGPAHYTQMGAYYHTTDVFVSPTLSDYRSLASFEAINAGRPAVLSVHDGAAQEIRRSGAAVQIVDPKDPQELADALKRYVIDPAFRASAAEAALSVPPEFSVAAATRTLTTAVLSTVCDKSATLTAASPWTHPEGSADGQA